MPRKQADPLEDLLSLGEHVIALVMKSRHVWRKHAQEALRHLAEDCDLVTRVEFEAATAMIAKARDLQEDLKERLNALEQKVNQSGVTMSRTDSRRDRSEKVKAARRNLRSVKHGKKRKRRQ